MKRLFAAAAALALFAAAGCSGSKVVPVSGTVKLDGKPYPNAIVTFQPIGGENNPNPGRGSAGITDSNGRYTLVHDGKDKGAVVGRHRVRIFTDQSAPRPAKEGTPEAAGENAGDGKEPIPINWHDESRVEIEVPPGGTDNADFNIETKPPAK